MIPYTGAMLADTALDLLSEIVPIVHARCRDKHVEALTVAMDALVWFPLQSAPRDGTQVMLAVAPHLTFDTPGFICIGRWVEPDASMMDGMGKLRRQRYEAAGGWWSANKTGKPFQRSVMRWRPVPTFDFAAAGYGMGEVKHLGGNDRGPWSKAA